jgi:hypothetical protein
MELKATATDALTDYLDYYAPLIGDKRTGCVFQGTVKGIIGAERLVCAQIAVHAPELAAGENSEQRIRRMVNEETTKRSKLDAASVTQRLRARGVEQLRGEKEVWVMADGSDLRKPYARQMEGLMRVLKLDKSGLVNGYRTLNAFGIGQQRRGILYHRLFSSETAEFVSEPQEVQTMLRTVIAATRPLGATIIWGLDSGFDDEAVWATIWAANQHLVGRLCHLNRLVGQRMDDGRWQIVSLAQAADRLHHLAVVETELVVQKRGQKCAKRQKVKAYISACPVRVTYPGASRTEKPGPTQQKIVWLVRVELEGLDWDPWWLLTDLPVLDEVGAVKVFRIYRQRWAAEDTFKVTKGCLGWEDVQLLDLTGIRNLVALGWVAAGFLYELGITFEWPELRLLARLGGWEARQDPERRPGKSVLMRGLRRLLDLAATEAILADEIATHGPLPPRLAALFRRSTAA